MASAPPWPSAHARLVETREALARFEASRRTRAERLDMLEFQRHEIDKVSPQAGEDDALEAEKTVVANAEKLARLAGEAYGALYDDDHAAMTSLATVWKRLGELAALDPRFQPILDARESVMAPLDDAARTLRDYADSIDRSPERLQAIEDRLAALARLKRRYGPTLDEVIAKSRAVADELGLLGAGDEALVALEQEAAAARDAPIAPPRTPSPPPGARPRRASPRRSRRRSPSSPCPARDARSPCTPSSRRASGDRRAPIGSSCSSRRTSARTSGRSAASPRAASCRA